MTPVGSTELIVSRVAIAPIKSGSLTHPDRLDLTASGARHDRRFFVTDEWGELLTARTTPALLQVRAMVTHDERLVLETPSGETIDHEIEPGEDVVTSFWGRDVAGRRVNGAHGDLVSRYLGRNARLIDTHVAGSAFDDASVTLISTASISEIAGDVALDPCRFRMNIVVDGCGPFEEERWIGRRVKLGTAVILIGAKVGRCVITSMDPDTATKGPDVLRLIARRRGKGDGLPLGVSGQVEVAGAVVPGDTVEVL